MKLISFLAAITMSTTVSAATLLDTVDSGLRLLTEQDKARAIVVGTYDSGTTTTTAYGQVSRDNANLPDGGTIFEIGSITKVFTVVLTQALVEKGVLAWSDTLAERLPDIDFTSEAVAAITLAELAGHISGLPRLPDNMAMEDPMDPYAGYDRALLDAFLASHAHGDLDKSYAYSNLGLGILGEIAADAAGTDYETALGTLIFSRFDMLDSGLTATDPARLAQAFSNGADMASWSGFDALAGAGAILSSTDDLMGFIGANLEGSDPLLSAVMSLANEAQTAFGWHKLDTEEGLPVYWHNGGTGGYASFLAVRPDNQTGVIILTASTEYDRVTELGIEQITGAQRTVSDLDLSIYEGSYELAPGFILSIFEDQERLFGQATGQGAFPLTPGTQHQFSFPAAAIEIVFDIPGDGPASGMQFTQDGNETRASRVASEKGVSTYKAIEIDPSLFAEYEGEFQLMPGVIISIFAREGQLFAQLTQQPAFPVFPYESDRFFYRVVDAQLHFERNEAGEVVAVILNQNGQQRAPRR